MENYKRISIHSYVSRSIVMVTFFLINSSSTIYIYIYIYIYVYVCVCVCGVVTVFTISFVTN
jgi:hypothetical protein